jgi:FAD/FMN-containing dehydrogenase
MDSHVVIDLSDMHGISIDSAISRAVIQTGARLGNIYVALGDKGFTMSGGTCPSVGFGGLMAAGGYGVLSRQYGLLIDNIVSAKMVNYKGEILNLNFTSHPDLFWAVRGGGGGTYGIVVEATVKIIPYQETSILHMEWPNTKENVKQVLSAWQTFQPFTTSKLTTQLNILSDKIILMGRYLGPQSELDQLTASSHLTTVQSFTSTSKVLQCDVFGSQIFFYGLNCENSRTRLATPTRLDPNDKNHSKGKSNFFSQILPPKALDIVAHYASSIQGSRDFLQFEAYGGFMDTVSVNSTPYPHRKGTVLSMQYVIEFGINEIVSETDQRYVRLRTFEEQMRPFGNGRSYNGYIDLDKKSDLSVYFGKENLVRLQRVKTMYDPFGIFTNPMSIKSII